MKKIILAAIILFAISVLPSCHKIKGNGPVTSQTYNVSDFSSLQLDISADVYYTRDNFYKVEIQAQPNIHSIIQTDVVNGELRIDFEKYKNIWNHDRIVVYVTAPSLSGLSVNGSGSIVAIQSVNTPGMTLMINGSGTISLPGLTAETLNASITGSGDITVKSGTVTSEIMRISGSGKIDLVGLSARYTTTETSGSGKTSVRVSDKLDIQISGSGDVYYTGNPSVHSVISGSGTVSHL